MNVFVGGDVIFFLSLIHFSKKFILSRHSHIDDLWTTVSISLQQTAVKAVISIILGLVVANNASLLQKSKATFLAKSRLSE